MKKMITMLLALVLLLTGCQTVPGPEETSATPQYDWMAGKSPVPAQRTGIKQQGITGIGNSFECTEDGSYFVCYLEGKGEFLLYGDHGSDTIILLCGRADCTHSGSTCDAYVFGSENICYYDGYLYTMSGLAMGKKLIRMNLDGTDKVTVLDTSSVYSAGKYSGTMGCMIWNGVLSFCPYKLDAEGNYVSDCYYYKLDGSMQSPELADYTTLQGK